MQVNGDAAELEETNRAAHEHELTAESAPARALLQCGRRSGLLRNQEAHRQHVRFEEAVALEEILRAQLGAIRQQRDPQKLFLLREIDRVFEQLRSVSVAAKRIVDDEVFEQEDKSAFGRADGKEEIDHSHDGAVSPEDENPAAIWFLED